MSGPRIDDHIVRAFLRSYVIDSSMPFVCSSLATTRLAWGLMVFSMGMKPYGCDNYKIHFSCEPSRFHLTSSSRSIMGIFSTLSFAGP